MYQKIKSLNTYDKVKSFYQIREGGRADKTARGSDYVFLNVGDKDASIVAKVWNASSQMLTLPNEVGKFIYVEGDVTSYQDVLEIKVDTLGNKTYTLEELQQEHPTLDTSLFLATADVPYEELKKDFTKYVNEVEYKPIAKIVRKLLSEQYKEFSYFPAAKKVHHTYLHGLMHHTVTMLKIAESLVEIYGESNIDKSILYGTILVHDLGKVQEYEETEKGSNVYISSLEGIAQGHIPIVHGKIIKAIAELEIDDTDIKIQLFINAVLSHHGKLEYGSPVKPISLEGQLVHYIDMIDSRHAIIKSTLETLELYEVSKPNFYLDKTPIVRHK